MAIGYINLMRLILALGVSSVSTDCLNFYPYYEHLLKGRRKTKTVRLGDQVSKYHEGAVVKLTCGWNPAEAIVVNQVKIMNVFSAPISSLRDEDLVGESPDCLTVAAVPYVLSAIYRKVVEENDVVTVIGWAYVD